MPFHKFPPKGYRKMEHPLPHQFEYNGGFNILDNTKLATMCTLLRSSEPASNTIASVEVNPANNDFVEETGPTCARGSIVPRLNFTFRASLSQAMLADWEFAKVQIQFLPIYTSFLNPLEALDDKTNETIEGIMELAHGVNDKKVYPLFNAVDMTNETAHPMNSVLDTELLGDYGLGTDTSMEYITFGNETMYNALQYYSISGMLKKVIGQRKVFTMSRDRPAFYHSNNFTNPSVKRMNPYTFCAVLIWCSKPGFYSHGHTADFDSATNKDLVHMSVDVKFDEWNPDFDQTEI